MANYLGCENGWNRAWIQSNFTCIYLLQISFLFKRGPQVAFNAELVSTRPRGGLLHLVNPRISHLN